jgi:hypothetical protein
VAAIATVAAVARVPGTQPGKQAHPTVAAVTARAVATAATAVAAAARAIAIAVAAMTSDGFLFTAQQGDADDREKDRDSK